MIPIQKPFLTLSTDFKSILYQENLVSNFTYRDCLIAAPEERLQSVKLSLRQRRQRTH